MKKNYGMIERYLNVTSGDVTNQKNEGWRKRREKEIEGGNPDKG